MSRDTIFALATPFAKSGVAVIRVSGVRALEVLKILTGKTDWEANVARYAAFGNIDKGLAMYFQAPKSFTGEDVVEFHLHGSLWVIREMLELLGKMEGLRPAEPGEFTRRAFLNGKMDLLEAEGLADLIDAETPAQKVQALAQMQGGMSRHYDDLRAQMVKSLALLEAYIDFPDEDIPDSALAQVEDTVAALRATIAATLEDGHRGERVREGIRVVILGAPNVGKSSLLNALSKRDAAIVSPTPGTTRDIIEVHMNIAGFPVILTDTAGLRDTSDAIEEEGVRRAKARAAEADITLLVLDASNTDTAIHESGTILVANKCDVLSCPSERAKPPKDDIIYISAKTGEGLEALEQRLKNSIFSIFSKSLSPVITRSRHRALLEEAARALSRFSRETPLELACEELRSAANAVGRITGKIAVDDVLDVVFKEFCIGK